jgi:WD40 repeat protein
VTREERKGRTAELFHEALTRTPDQRFPFLAEACAGDEELFRKVKDLLDADAEVRTSYPGSSPGEGLAPFTLDPDVLIALSERYDGIEFIGRGGMGVVFRARDREIDKVVALKLLRPSFANDERMIERFRNEIRLSLDIAHKNVCRTHALERFNGTIVISMEYVEGETLRTILDCVKGASVPQGLVWSQEICDALEAAHEKKIVHRDLKPENIMIDREGHVKVMDFGIARSVEAGEGVSGTIIGTPRYMSPEQAQGKAIGPASDIYSLGLVLFELFTGVRGNPERLAAPRQSNPYLPAHIDRAIRRCLEENPKDRFQSASELKTALVADQEIRKSRRVVTRIVMLCALLAALVICGVLVVQKGRAPTAGMHQDDQITDLEFSPHGHLLASASEDKTIALWDVTNQRRIHTLADHIRAVTCVAFSSNGRWLASGSADKTMKVWDVETGHLAYTLSDTKTIAALALSPDGHWLASTSDDTVKIWDVLSARVAHVLRHRDSVNSIAFNGDGRLVASGSDDSTVKVWEVETGRLVGGPLPHDDAVQVVAFSPDGRLIASGGYFKTITLWSATTWLSVQTLLPGAQVKDLAFNVDGSRLMSMSRDGKVTLWEAPTWRESGNLMVKEWDAASISAFSPDGRILALGFPDGAIKLQPLTALNVCVRGTTGLTGTAAWTSAAPPPKPWV